MSNYKKIAEIANNLDNQGYQKEAEFVTALLEKKLNKVVAQLHRNSDHMEGIEILKEPLEVHYVENPDEDSEESNNKFAFYLNTGRTVTAQFNDSDDNYPEGGTWKDRVDENPNGYEGPEEDDDTWMEFLKQTGLGDEPENDFEELDPEEREFSEELNKSI